MTLRIYNSLTRDKQEFTPMNPPNVSFYSCGPTVYGEFHVGNARTFVVNDMIRRWLLELGYKVRFAQNITDVDDKIIAKAEAEGTTPEAIAEKYTNYFFEKLRQLGNLPADDHPKATQHIGPMIALIKKLEQKGNAYATPDGSVWFDVGSFAEYGKLSRRPLDEMRQGERVDATIQGMKRSPTDFALWKGAKPGEPAWKSPWGEGRPGWHIECSCMSMKTFGAETIDIHSGGTDLLFPHHENEIAQSEAATGKQFVRYWMHSGMLDIDGEKMSKSLGNIRTIDQVFTICDPLTLRYFLLSAKYRDKLDFTEDTLRKCESATQRMVSSLREAKRLAGGFAADAWNQDLEVVALWEEFAEAMDDDFNTPRALGAMAKLVTVLNTARTEVEAGSGKEKLTAAASLLARMREVLGLGESLEKPDKELRAEDVALLKNVAESVRSSVGDEHVEPPFPEQIEASDFGASLIDYLVAVRAWARREKNFALGDQIRVRLAQAGIALEDKPGGTIWKKDSSAIQQG